MRTSGSIMPASTPEIGGALEYNDVEGGPGTGGLTVNSLVLEPGEMMAVTGGASGAREAMLKLGAGLATPISGRVSLGGKSLADATLPQIGHALAYVGSEPGIVSRTMRENLLYGLFRGAPDLATETSAMLADMLREAEMTGNTTAHPEGDWIDYEQAGYENAEELDDRLLELVEMVGLSNEVYSAALEARVDPSQADVWTERIMPKHGRTSRTWARICPTSSSTGKPISSIRTRRFWRTCSMPGPSRSVTISATT